jgi:hypothetical protein
MTIYEAIIESLKDYSAGETFSLIGLTEKIISYRGKLVTDGCVSRRLREMKTKKKEEFLRHILQWEVVKGGLYKIVENKPVNEAVYEYPSERLFL